MRRHGISRSTLRRSLTAAVLAVLLAVCIPVFSTLNTLYAAANSIVKVDTSGDSANIDEVFQQQFQHDDTDLTLSDTDAQVVSDADAVATAFLKANQQPINTTEEGIINILLIGCDTNEYKGYMRSDSMIILSINTVTGSVKLISLMRDMRVMVGGGYDKLNAAFAYDSSGQLLLETIRENFLIDIEDFVCINYRAFRRAVDALGGVTVTVEEDDIKAINKCISDETQHIQYPGEQLLNGTQTLAFCQMRSVGTDIARTARQRIVMTELLRMAEDMSISDMTELIEATMPNILTNMTQGELFWLALKAVSMDNITVSQMRIPIDHSWQDVVVDQRWYISFNHKKNVDALHDMIYGENLTDVSESDVDG